MPLPYHGRFSADKNYPTCQPEPAGLPLRAALEAWLVSALEADALPGNAEPGAFSHGFLVNGVDVNVTAIETPGSVSIAFPTGKAGDPAVIGDRQTLRRSARYREVRWSVREKEELTLLLSVSSRDSLRS